MPRSELTPRSDSRVGSGGREFTEGTRIWVEAVNLEKDAEKFP